MKKKEQEKDKVIVFYKCFLNFYLVYYSSFSNTYFILIYIFIFFFIIVIKLHFISEGIIIILILGVLELAGGENKDNKIYMKGVKRHKKLERR